MLSRNVNSVCGFSIVEALVIVVIIGILATLGYSRYEHHVAKTRQGEAKNNLELIVSLQEAFLLEHGRYSYLEPVGLDNSGENKHFCKTDNPGYDMLNELGFRPKDCEELRYRYRSPIFVKRDGHTTATPPRYTVRADSNPASTKVYIWPACDSKDMWRVNRTAGGDYGVKQPIDHEFENTGKQRRALENCK